MSDDYEDDDQGERFEAMRKAAQKTRRKVANRKAKGGAGNVVMLPSCERTVPALAYSLGVASEAFGWAVLDVRKRPWAFSVLVHLPPGGAAGGPPQLFTVRRGVTPEKILKAALVGLGRRSIADFDEEDYGEAWMRAEALGGDQCFGVMIDAVIDEAMRKRWLRVHPITKRALAS
jgi:hypothetical protein